VVATREAVRTGRTLDCECDCCDESFDERKRKRFGGGDLRAHVAVVLVSVVVAVPAFELPCWRD